MDRVQNPDVFPEPDLLDIQRAALCSACTYQEASWCKSELLEFSSVQLSQVLMGERGGLHNLVLAIAPLPSSYTSMPNQQQQEEDSLRSTLFIAFPGSTTPEDWLVDLDTRQQRLISRMGLFGESVPGQFHAGFSRRLKEILPDMHLLRNYVRELGCIRRLVFCGHSLGGALAHMALITFVITTGVFEAACDHISIGFGSPPFCDADAQQYLSNGGLSARMFTYINNEDPIPFLLNSMQQTKATLKKFLVNLALSRLHMRNWFAPSSGESRSSPSTRQYKVEFGAVWIALLTAFENSNTAPRYAPLGQIYNLGDNGHLKVLDSDYHGGKQVDLTWSNLQKHRSGSYLRSLQVRATDHGSPMSYSNVIQISPQITGAEVEFEGRHKAKKKAKIIVRGDNLFLPLGFTVSSKSWRSRKAIEQLRWKIANESSSRKVVLNLENEVDPSMIALLTEAGKARSTGGLSVSVTTCFGTSTQSEVIVKDPWFGSYIKCVLCRCICKLLLMSRCGFLPEHVSRKAAMTDLECMIRPESFHIDWAHCKFHDEMEKILDKILDPFIKEFSEHRNVPTTETYFEWLVSCCKSRSEPANPYNDSLILLLQFLNTNDQREEPGKEAFLYERKIYDHFNRSAVEERLKGLEDFDERRRILKIFKVFSAHEHLEKVKTVAFVGPRFAGKSTLINCLMMGEVAGRMSSQQSPEVESFMMEQGQHRKLMLVEVPGAGQREMRWRDLQHLADLVVVVVSFAGETDDHAEGFAEEARRLGLCENVIVVVNGVDRVLHGNQEASLWERYHCDYLEKRRRHFARRARVPYEDVLMSVASPPNDLEANTKPRLEERNVKLREEITLSLHDRISSLYTTTRLNYPFVATIRAAPVGHEL